MKRQFHPTNPFRPENGIWPDEDRYLDDDQIANQIPSANSIQHWQWSDRGDSTELKITEIGSPYKFWFHLKVEDAELFRMDVNLNNYYKLHLDSNRLELGPEHMRVGQACAVFSQDEQWRRAEIVQATNQMPIKVYLVDIGRVESVNIDNLRLLPQSFADKGRYARRGCLDQIWPYDFKWNIAVVRCFNDLVSNRQVFGRPTFISDQKQVSYLKLVVVQDNNTYLNVNNRIVDQGLALYIEESAATFKKRHFSEIYPTFEMLELGQYSKMQELAGYKSEL